MNDDDESSSRAPTTAAAAARLSIVAVNYNGAALVERLADAVWGSDSPPLELVVVDNASPDGSAERLRARSDIVLVESEHNLGFGQGCMLGARAARGDLLLFVNPDVLPIADAFARLARNYLLAPSVAVSFPKMVAPGQDVDSVVMLEDVASALGAAFLTSRAHLEEMGGFDPRMFLYYEETDLCWRTRLGGRRVVQDWEAWIHHDDHGSGGGDRWAAEQVRNGLLAHIRLRSWRGVGLFIAWSAAKTVVRGMQMGDRELLDVWPQTLRRLPGLLAERHRIRAASTPLDRAALEALCRTNDYWRWFYRRRAMANRAARLIGR